eukprot:TRINITY_DN574_c0_g2_i2.p2 TRINITY_DN574_c0_g2~~TRINITY_DN574_c0_g2_i2.p2  ORF type:complete len:223 (+),score=26.36 TRINITY_DN574_c0_g2_i2:672-1340(+)
MPQSKMEIAILCAEQLIPVCLFGWTLWGYHHPGLGPLVWVILICFTHLGFLNASEMDGYLKEIGLKKEAIRTMLVNAFGGDIFRCVRSFASRFLDKEENEDKFKKMIDSEINMAYNEIMPTWLRTLSSSDRKIVPQLYSELVKAQHNQLPYVWLQEKYGEQPIENIIKSNAAYLLTGPYISADRKKDETERLVIANCPLQQVAMNKFFSKPQKKCHLNQCLP